jgi:hypothetical protein
VVEPHFGGSYQNPASAGVFKDGGREVYFADGRETIRGLAVTRTALKAAIEAMRRAAGR